MTHLIFFAGLVSACAVLLASAGCGEETSAAAPVIDGELAMKYAQGNYDLGPRVFRTEGAAKSAEWIRDRAIEIPGLLESGAEVRVFGSQAVRNVEIATPPNVGGVGPDNGDFIVFGAHHDTKKLFSVPDFAGANDGASGVGALLAMAQACVEHMQTRSLPCGLRFVFFDGEEALYQYTEGDGLLGSYDYVDDLRSAGETDGCRAMILLDMIGDKDLRIVLAGNSTPGLANVVLEAAGELGYGPKFSPGDMDMLDDHYPFLQAGIPAVDLIDFEFGPENRYWHTEADTMDKISAESMKTAADVALLTAWKLAANGFKDLPK